MLSLGISNSWKKSWPSSLDLTGCFFSILHSLGLKHTGAPITSNTMIYRGHFFFFCFPAASFAPEGFFPVLLDVGAPFSSFGELP